jgi:pyruvate formate lyase activating enzyme
MLAKHNSAIDAVPLEGPDRRAFLKTAALAGCGVAVAAGWPETALALPKEEDESRYVREAKFYEKLPNRKIKCKLCPRECVVDAHERGYCGVRENRNGIYYTLVHSRVASLNVDPIEKKPFHHFLPGALAFSLATAGCNVNCKMCQNWEISQSQPEQLRSMYLPPVQVAAAARQYRCPVIAYTYSEPTVFMEYVLDSIDAGRAQGVKSVVVSGGYVQQDPLKQLCRRADGIKVDLKAITEKFYKDVVRGELKPVLEGLVTIRAQGVWNEIVYLVVPTLNDTDAEFREVARWVKANLGVDVPVHFTRFHPEYLLKNLPPTPVPTLERAKAIADAEGLHYVYLGNVTPHPAESTYCPKCRRVVVDRVGLTVRAVRLKNGKCPYCQQVIPGVWS